MMTKISIANDFSEFPAGRYLTDGKFSGEKFRISFLIPKLKNTSDKIYINMDGTMGYPSSFLEEAFGGLIDEGFDLETLTNRIVLVAENPAFSSYTHEAWEYIKDRASKKELN